MSDKPILVPPLWFLIFAALIVAVGKGLPGPVFYAPGRTAIAVTLSVIGLGLAFAALSQFRSKGTTFHPEDPTKTTALVTGGVYRVTRNPMYVGMALILFALAIWLGSLLGSLLVLVFIGVITAVQIIPEERALTELFGPEFEAFKRRTPRWLFL